MLAGVGRGATGMVLKKRTRHATIVLMGAILVVVVLLGPRLGLWAKKSWPAEPLAINKATVEQLASLPGVGPVLAKRIVEFRAKHGPFRRLEELLVIQGMSRKKFESLKPHLRLD